METNEIIASPICSALVGLLCKEGFLGIIGCETIGQMQANGCKNVPNEKGVFLVLNPDTCPPTFMPIGTGGHYKGIDPNVGIQVLQENWVANTCILYVGESSKLKTRIRNFTRFGNGCNTIDACGGRYVWQLSNNKSLVVCWILLLEECDSPEVKKWLIRTFKKRHGGNIPFANISDPT